MDKIKKIGIIIGACVLIAMMFIPLVKGWHMEYKDKEIIVIEDPGFINSQDGGDTLVTANGTFRDVDDWEMMSDGHLVISREEEPGGWLGWIALSVLMGGGIGFISFYLIRHFKEKRKAKDDPEYPVQLYLTGTTLDQINLLHTFEEEYDQRFPGGPEDLDHYHIYTNIGHTGS